jgi:hypothetical protein
MKSIQQIRDKLERHRTELVDRFYITEIGVFGSVARNEQTEFSDLDILVEFSKTPSFLKYMDLEIYLSNLLEIKVDLVMKTALKQSISTNVLSEVIYL